MRATIEDITGLDLDHAMGASGGEPCRISVIDAIWAIPEDERVPDVIAEGLVVSDGDIDIAIFVEVGGDAA